MEATCHDGVKRLHGRARNTERGDEELLFNTLMTEHGDDIDRWRQVHTLNDVDINNNPQETWGRTDYMKGDITGNTWDEIKTQTETN